MYQSQIKDIDAQIANKQNEMKSIDTGNPMDNITSALNKIHEIDGLEKQKIKCSKQSQKFTRF